MPSVGSRFRGNDRVWVAELLLQSNALVVFRSLPLDFPCEPDPSIFLF
jgi:hypothetical protein